MQQIPVILIQIVHIEGPLKGQIQEFSATRISIGRHPSCDVRFPATLNIVSRQHASIERDGNRFKVVDSSSNGTLLNGKPIKEAYLKDGDVLTIAQGGPKISFLSKMTDQFMSPERPKTAAPPTPASQEPQAKPVTRAPSPPTPEPVAAPVPPPQPLQPVPVEPPSPAIEQRSKAPFIIQFGPTLRTFDELPIRIGQSGQCEFPLPMPGIADEQAMIFFVGGQYWIKDLTGKRQVYLNGQPVEAGSVLQPEDELSLSPQGPFFKFLSGGRLAECEAPAPVASPPASQAPPSPSAKGATKSHNLLERFWRRGKDN